MTLRDFLKRVDLDKDLDKMMLHCDYLWDDCEQKFVEGWTNVDLEVTDLYIKILPDTSHSPFSSDN